jgi:uncharacterized protein (TIGR03437 family)
VLYAGRAPGFTGLNQLNITLTAGISSGTHTLVVMQEWNRITTSNNSDKVERLSGGDLFL